MYGLSQMSSSISERDTDFHQFFVIDDGNNENIGLNRILA